LRLIACSVRQHLLVVLALLGACFLWGAQAAQAVPSPAFTEVSGSPFSTPGNPSVVAFSPDGRLAAVADGDGTVAIFSVAAGGAPTPVPGSPFTVGGSSSSVAFSPDGSLLAVTDTNADQVDVLSVAADGELTPIAGSPFNAGAATGLPFSVAFSPVGKLLAVSNYGGDANTIYSVSMFAVAPGGAITPVAGSPFGLGAGNQPFSVAFSPSGGLLSTANTNGNTVSVFTVAVNGALTQVTGSPYSTGSGSQPLSVAFSADGGLLATANSEGNSVSVFSVASGGTLSDVVGSPFSSGNGTRTVAFGPGGLLAAANYFAGTVSVFSPGAGGTLTPIAGSPFTSDSYPTSVAFSSSAGAFGVAELFSGLAMFGGGSPVAQVSSPTPGRTYPLNQRVTTSFGCADPSGAPGIGSCTDSNGVAGSTDSGSGSTGSGVLDTSTTGVHSYTITASSTDALTGTATINYTVLAAAAGVPVNTALPVVTGAPVAGMTLSCSTGTWSDPDATYSYQWDHDSSPITGATTSSYTVQASDEGLTLTCAVVASNRAGAGVAAVSNAVSVHVPVVPMAPRATGRLTRQVLGRVKLGMTRAQAQAAYTLSSTRSKRYEEFFSLTPIGVRVGYTSDKLLSTIPSSERSSVRGLVVLALTANPYYALSGVRPGATLAAARRTLGHGNLFQVGLNHWYLDSYGSWTAVLKVRHGIVEEVGIANAELTRTRTAQRTFITSFS